MSSIAITPSATGTGVFTIAAPNGNINRTLTLPDATGTVQTVDGVLTQFNASGSAPVYACRAWVNFNGTGTVAIRASGNVSSITDNGVGDYTVNFTTAMPDVNYAGVWGGTGINVYPALGIGDPSWVSINSIRGRYFAATTAIDLASVNLAVFR